MTWVVMTLMVVLAWISVTLAMDLALEVLVVALILEIFLNNFSKMKEKIHLHPCLEADSEIAVNFHLKVKKVVTWAIWEEAWVASLATFFLVLVKDDRVFNDLFNF